MKKVRLSTFKISCTSQSINPLRKYLQLHYKYIEMISEIGMFLEGISQVLMSTFFHIFLMSHALTAQVEL